MMFLHLEVEHMSLLIYAKSLDSWADDMSFVCLNMDNVFA